MLSASDAAAKTAMGRASISHGHEMRTIEKRIDGAASAGLSNVEVIFEGNAFDEETSEVVKQALLDEGYRVQITQQEKLGNLKAWQFNISW